MPPNVSDKLKRAMSEIKAVLTRHDIAGYVVLYDAHLSEYLLRIDPTWSVAFIEDDGLRFRSRLADFNGDREAQVQATDLTVGMLRHFADLLARDRDNFERILAALAKVMDIEHTEGVHTPHRTH